MSKYQNTFIILLIIQNIYVKNIKIPLKMIFYIYIFSKAENIIYCTSKLEKTWYTLFSAVYLFLNH